MLSTRFIETPSERELALPDERRRLVRLCARLTGKVDVAEDLAQETLLEAWRNRRKLRDPLGRDRWLAAIARHVCQRWARGQGRALARLTRLDGDDDPATPPPADWLADETDLELELERAELATLLDRALALLPLETRAVLVARCIEETPQAEVAARLGLSESAVGVRLHRGKLALRRVLATDLREDAAAYGLDGPAADGWQETRIWCPRCGQRRIRGKFITSNLPATSGDLMLRCPSCHTLPDDYMMHHTDHWAGTLVDVRGIKAAYSRLLRWADAYYRQGLVDRTVVCMKCGRQAPLWMGLEGPAPPSWRDERGVHVTCHACNPTNITTLAGIALALPEGRSFWQAHPRTRRLPDREVETAGRAAVVVSHVNVTGAARFDVVFDRDNFAVLGIHQTPGS
jgi:RNA polymerase sigma factor (sigma-70 family)